MNAQQPTRQSGANAQFIPPGQDAQRPTAAFLMGLDLGTSAIKGVLIDAKGNEIATAEKRTTFIHPAEGWVEVDPEQHYQDVCGVIRELAAAVFEPIAALAMSAASGNTLLADETGKPLTSIISWMDQRATQNLPEVLKPLSPEAVRQVIGWPRVDRFPLAHLAWFRENVTGVFRSAKHYCMNTDWVLFRLTENWVMDHSMATTFHLQDQVAKRYYLPFLNLLDIQEDKLSLLTDSGIVAGQITQQAANDTGLPLGTAVVTGCFDHPSAARAVGVLKPRQLMLSCGTSWTGFFPEEQRQHVIDAELLCDPFLSGQGGPWGAMFSVSAIGRTIDAYIDHVIAPNEDDKFTIFNELAARASPGAAGLKIDLRAPPARMNADRKNISRAVMEGAARLLHDKVKQLASRGINFKQAVMVGGPSKSPVWPRIVEEITGIQLSVGSRHAGARGAALLAGIGIGLYRDETEAYKMAASTHAG